MFLCCPYLPQAHFCCTRVCVHDDAAVHGSRMCLSAHTKPPQDLMTPRSDVADTSEPLPTTIQSLLDEWYSREGRQKPPPCAVTASNNKTLHSFHDGKPATYTHNSGEPLAVEMFALPEFSNSKSDHTYIVVARGATLGPVYRHCLPKLWLETSLMRAERVRKSCL